MFGNIVNYLLQNVKIRSKSSDTQERIGGHTLSEWDRMWKCIGPLKNAEIKPYNHSVGLYRHMMKGRIMYIGRAIELHNGGLRKRLSDYRRPNNSGRKHSSGKLINEHLDEIVTYVLVVGDTEEAVLTTKRLEGMFIRKYQPEWNKNINV